MCEEQNLEWQENNEELQRLVEEMQGRDMEIIKVDKTGAETRATLEQYRSEIMVKLERERDQEKTKISSLQGNLPAMLAD